MLALDPLEPPTPRLPHPRSGTLTPLAASVAVHLSVALIAAVLATGSGAGTDVRRSASSPSEEFDVQHLVFLAPPVSRLGSGGGGGGNQQQDPIRRAQGVGADAITLRARSAPAAPAPVSAPSAPARDDVPAIPSIVLDAQPLASGVFDQIGLPAVGATSGTSTGPAEPFPHLA